MKTERQLRTQVLSWIKRNAQNALVIPLNDRWMSGLPDLLLIYKSHYRWIELKKENGRVSKAQEYMHKRIQDVGGQVFVCRILEDVINIIDMIDFEQSIINNKP